MGRLIEPIERRTFAAVADRPLEIADRGRRVRKHRQRPAATIAIRIACGEHPVIVKAGQQFAAAQRKRRLVLSGGDQSIEGARVDPRFRLAGETECLAAGDQHALRRRAERATNAR